MLLTRETEGLQASVTVLGMFDGVHRGHQALLMQGAALAEAQGLPLNVCTFEPHPLTVLRPDKAPARLTTQAERAQLMAGFGVDSLCVLPFTRRMADQLPEDFMARMVETLAPRTVVCGFNFTFGRRGMGNGETLTAYGATHGFETVIVPEVVLEGATVSSTRIRALLDGGCIREASRLLGHAYTLAGQVAEDGAHMAVSGKKALPLPGAYACYLTVDGQHYPAVAHIDGGVRVQVLDGFLPLAGRRIRLTLMDLLCQKDGTAPAEILRRARTFFFSVV